MTITSGLQFDNDDFSVAMRVGKPDNPLRYMLDKPLYADPGEKFYYRDTDAQLVGYAMRELTGKTEQELAADTLFSVLDIKHYYWEADHDGINLAAHGLQMIPRDLAKLGQVLLDGGVWRGTGVLSEAWIEQATGWQIDSNTCEWPLGPGFLLSAEEKSLRYLRFFR